MGKEASPVERGIIQQVVCIAVVLSSPSDPGAYKDVVEAVVLFNMHNNSAAAAVVAELPGLFDGQIQVRACRSC